MHDHTRILDHLRRGHDGEPWHGPSLRDLLAHVDATTAAARPVPGAHSIWEIVRHLTLWILTARRRLAGEPLEHEAGDDWPPVTSTTPEAWLATLDVLEQAHTALLHAVERLPADALHEPVPGQRYTAAFMLHGLAQHAAYHGGQIALLARAGGAPPSDRPAP